MSVYTWGTLERSSSGSNRFQPNLWLKLSTTFLVSTISSSLNHAIYPFDSNSPEVSLLVNTQYRLSAET
jgi:hypothetical protein